MKQFKLFIFLFFTFMAEGTIMMHFIPYENWGHIQIVPDFLFVLLLMVAFFADEGWGMRYAIVFGLLTDLVYTSIIGVYAFSMGLAVYVTYSLSKWVNMNIVMTAVLSAFGVFFLQTEVYLIYLMIRLTDQPMNIFFQWRIPATIGLNIVFTLVVYFPFKRFLSGMKKTELD
ncbi:rod shape-determining protein MreD [Sporolactobacillus shoreae]|uniref:Rod shape-determining protein MreD n=1 Tax=Sporolactobacillus shoreae TaxID=1465501 RepID=A0A4Z0GT84_9BACL|nr:rod shape-determining protein MreD [Sporolactobacillus shoreae]TGA99486.1 rod shape-determining protein MreD [Sporolactobacillus shoreae]